MYNHRGCPPTPVLFKADLHAPGGARARAAAPVPKPSTNGSASGGRRPVHTVLLPARCLRTFGLAGAIGAGVLPFQPTNRSLQTALRPGSVPMVSSQAVPLGLRNTIQILKSAAVLRGIHRPLGCVCHRG
uniref:Uncharacterized protein n=1 Tax=Eutreptiella gymnastica TaxID=73025 RepID=A0A7S4FW86_9EUGL